MGVNKALLDVGGATMVGRTADLLRPLADDLFIVADDAAAYAALGLRVVPDLVPGRGSLGGIWTAVARAANPFVLCVACDMPFIAPPLLFALLDGPHPGEDAVIPRLPTGPEPLLAVYSRTLLPAMERAVAAGDLRIMAALERARVRFLEGEELERLDPGGRSFLNVNTPGELAEARSLTEGPRS